MKTILKNVYYCDHCKKRGLSASHMIKHEVRCTANPNRDCGKCDGHNIAAIVAELKPLFFIDKHIYDEGGTYTFKWLTERQVTLQEIKDMVDGCPNCTLAVLRQTNLNYKICGLDVFDYKKEFQAYGFSEARQKEYERGYYGFRVREGNEIEKLFNA